MSESLKRLKRVDTRSTFAVFGYIREIETTLSLFSNVPELISYISLSYYIRFINVQYGKPWGTEPCKYYCSTKQMLLINHKKGRFTYKIINKTLTDKSKYIGKEIKIKGETVKQVKSKLILSLKITSNAILMPCEVYVGYGCVYRVFKRFGCNARKYTHRLEDRSPDGGMPLNTIKHIASQVLDGLTAIHALKLGHGHLKPSNILITEQKQQPPIVKIDDLDRTILIPVEDVYNPKCELGVTYIKYGSESYIHILMVLSRHFYNKHAAISVYDNDIYGFAAMIFAFYVGMKNYEYVAKKTLYAINEVKFYAAIKHKCKEIKKLIINDEQQTWLYYIIYQLECGINAKQFNINA
eukprot:190108_1